MKHEIFGLDFSAAADPGEKIWISKGHLKKDEIVLEYTESAKALWGNLVSKEDYYTKIRDLVLENPSGVFGMDFSFNLPKECRAGATWKDFICSIRRNFLNAEDFRAHCLKMTGGREKRRKVELDMGAPLSPYNLWIYKQTYHGMRDILSPLMDSASIVPYTKALTERPWILEVYPGLILKERDLYIPYKGTGHNKSTKSQNRELIVDEVTSKSVDGLDLKVDESFIAKMKENSGGDALDSFMALLVTYRFYKQFITNKKLF
ncbi:hypothetical protein DSECCO2_90340 [anaerobic digester metagenome]